MTKRTIACIQMRSGRTVPQNISDMERLVQEAASKGATYILTPEMTGLLERNRSEQFEKTRWQDDDETFRAAQNLARGLGIWLHVGSTAIRVAEDRLANRAGLFSPQGELVATYDKIHMFDVDLDNGESWRESSVYQPGAIARTVPVDGFILGLSVCYDIRFPDLYRQMAKSGAQVLTCPAAFTRQTGEAHWHTLLKARAIENGAYMIAAAQGGKHEDGRETFGHSLVVNPWGEIIAELDNDEPGYLVAEIDLNEVSKARKKIPNLRNNRAFELETLG